MGDNAKICLEQAILDLCETKHLSKITVTDVLKASGITKSCFYSNFRDINDLYHYIYWERIAASSWPGLNKSYDDYLSACIIINRKIKNRYGKFFLQAIECHGQNCLEEFILEKTVAFDFNMAKQFYSYDKYDRLLFACRFYAHGWIHSRCDWIRSGYKMPIKEFAQQICDSRFALLTWLMGDNEKAKSMLQCPDLAIISDTSIHRDFH